MKLKLILMVFIMTNFITAQTKYPDINEEINKGNYTKATEMIDEILQKNSIPELEKQNLEFQKDRMERIKLDFRKTKKDILDYVRNYYPDADEDFLKQFEDDKSLEYKIIDGEKLYFNRSHTNLFRISKKAKEQKLKVEGKKIDGLDKFLSGYLPNIVEKSEKLDRNLVSPVKLKLNYSITVDKNVVPEGETIRCWMPFPRKGHDRQRDINLTSTNVDEYVIADNDHLQRSIYMEKQAEKDKPTVFEMELSLTTFAERYDLKAGNIKPYDKNSELYKKFTAERAPHILFSDRIKKLSEEVVGSEANPYLAAKKIYEWIDNNIPWAGAREYSTIKHIPEYCLENMHGDCGIQTLLFITLCRYNGIPAKWQSGWMLHPGEVNLHDWGEVYFEGYGWVPVDQSFSLQNSDNENVRYYYLGGIDAYRLIVNDDYSRDFYPAKIFPRSETVDFQRGEVEWKGGNLYFNKWDYHMDVEYIE